MNLQNHYQMSASDKAARQIHMTMLVSVYSYIYQDNLLSSESLNMIQDHWKLFHECPSTFSEKLKFLMFVQVLNCYMTYFSHRSLQQNREDTDRRGCQQSEDCRSRHSDTRCCHRFPRYIHLETKAVASQQILTSKHLCSI